MSATASVNEASAENVRRNLVARLEDCRRALRRQPLSDKDVHSIRKTLKQARASLRLLRDALGESEYRRLNHAVRDAARPLTPLRDTSVMLQALDTVSAEAEESPQVPATDKLRRALRREHGRHRRQLQESNIAAIRRSLNNVKASLQQLSDPVLERIALDDARERAHRNARKAFKAAKREASDDKLHEWRKQVKYEFNQLELLQALASRPADASVEKIHKLSDHLGDDHDLAILHERIVAQAEQARSAATVAGTDALLETIESMRATLQRKARHSGKSLYTD